jgi:hypothetical protein
MQAIANPAKAETWAESIRSMVCEGKITELLTWVKGILPKLPVRLHFSPDSQRVNHEPGWIIFQIYSAFRPPSVPNHLLRTRS